MSRNWDASTSNYISLGDISTARFDSGSSWAVMAFFRTESTAADQNIIAKWSNNVAKRQFGIELNVGTSSVGVNVGGTFNVLDTGAFLAANTWYLVAVTHASGTNAMAVYVYGMDGTLVASDTGTHPGDVAELDADIFIGLQGNATKPFDGDIAWVTYIRGFVDQQYIRQFATIPHMTLALLTSTATDVEFFLPINGTVNPEPDWGGNGITATVNGTLTVSDMPPVSSIIPLWDDYSFTIETIEYTHVLDAHLVDIAGEVFCITHDANNLDEYDSTVTDSGDLSVSSDAAMGGSDYGLSCLIDDQTAIYGQKDFTQLTNVEYRYRVYIDPNSLTMTDGDAFRFLEVLEGASNRRSYLTLGYTTALGFSCWAVAVDDNAAHQTTSTNVTITDGPHYVEVHLEYASSAIASDGRIRIWVDGVLQDTVSDLDIFDISKPDNARLGAPEGLDAGTSGTFYLDEFCLRDDGEVIGGTVQKTHTLGGLLLETKSATYQQDAVLLQAQSATYVLDSLLVLSQATTYQLDANLLRTQSETHILESFITAEGKRQFFLGGVLLVTQTATATALDADLLRTQSETGQLDADLLRTQAATYSLDAAIQETPFRTFELDGLLLRTQSASYQLDAYIAFVIDKAFTLDANLFEIFTETVDFDADLLRSQLATHSLFGSLAETQPGITNRLDAVLSETALTETVDFDANLKRLQQALAEIDGVVKRAQSATHSLDAAMGQTDSHTNRLDAVLLETLTPGQATIDAALKQTQTGNTTLVDANIKQEANQLTAIQDGILLVANSQTFVLDGPVKETRTLTGEIDLLAMETRTLQAVLDHLPAELRQKTFVLTVGVSREDLIKIYLRGEITSPRG